MLRREPSATCERAEQRDSGLGLQAQRDAIEGAWAARGWELVGIEEDIASGAKTDRPGLKRALEAVESDEVDCIIVLRLDRLSRSVADFARMLEHFPRGLVCLDLGIDPSTPAGEMTATVVAAMAQMERRLIGQRTKDALAVRRAEGEWACVQGQLSPRTTYSRRGFLALVARCQDRNSHEPRSSPCDRVG
jgi:DNA invertase Pin-like site-specific DNA recombinase